MKIAVIGSGGREHALLWKLSQSSSTHQLFALPGNGGTSTIAKNIDVNIADTAALLESIVSVIPDLVVIGPEGPLAAGIVDMLNERQIPCFGPTARAARLESSKAFAKELMQRYGIPTADFRVFDDYSTLETFVKQTPYDNGWVVKADGLAAGKGAIVCSSVEEVLHHSHAMLCEQSFGEAGQTVVIERKLRGREVSAHFFCDGERYLALPPAQDYKRALNNDEGFNTGGMGTYCPASHLTPELYAEVETTVVEPVLRAMSAEGSPYKGVLYVGLMLTDNGPKVIEFNCRFGDPETQVMLPVWTGDLVQVMLDCAAGQLSTFHTVHAATSAAVCVVLAAEGYPSAYAKGIPLIECRDTDNAFTLHAGSVRVNDHLSSTGGRVLNAIGTGVTIQEARQHAYELAQRLCVPGLRYRSDIGNL